MPVRMIVLDEGDLEDMRAGWDDVVGGGLGSWEVSRSSSAKLE
jgi:hypothetical protein